MLDLMLMSPDEPPRKLMRAFEIIARDLHPTFEVQPWIKPGISTESCVLCALAVRDFLLQIGFASAKAESVMMTIRAFDAGNRQLHSLGVGVPGEIEDSVLRWNGHMVVTVSGWLIDMTLARMRRKQWPWLTTTAVIPLAGDRTVIDGWRLLAGGATPHDGGRVEMAWYIGKGNDRWRSGPDAKIWRRRDVATALAERYREREVRR